jgi:hypothetical protein
MKIRLIGNCLIITTNQKPKKNDWMCTLQVGYTNQRTGRIVIPNVVCKHSIKFCQIFF